MLVSITPNIAKDLLKKNPNGFRCYIKNTETWCIDCIDDTKYKTIIGIYNECEVEDTLLLKHGWEGLIPLKDVTRIELISEGGREFVTYDASNVHISIQDGKRTLKVFF